MVDLSREIIVRWAEPDARHIPLLKQGGITCAVLPERNEAFDRAGIRTIALSEFHFASWEEIASAPAGKMAVLTDGRWPGVARGPDRTDEDTSSASREPWVDADSYWAACLRAAFPKRPALLGYEPDEKAGVTKDRVIGFDSLELALIDAWVGGGNYLLALMPEYRAGLLKGDERALTAWRSLGRTAAWLRENAPLFRQAVMPEITQLVEPGTESAELANLLCRRGASQALASAADPPAPAPDRILALVAAGIHPPSPALTKRILAHAESGATVITDEPGEQAWWRAPGLKPLKSQEDREFFAAGRGQVLAYHEKITDPSEFALDVIDVITHRRRAARIWNASSSIPVATFCPRAVGAALLHLVTYGFGGRRSEVLARIQGNYTKATIAGPARSPEPLKVARRGTTTEVEITGPGRLSVVIFG